MDAVTTGPVPNPAEFKGCGGKPLSPDCAQFLAACLQKEPEERATIDTLLDAPWFKRLGIGSVEDAKAALAHAVGSSASSSIGEGGGRGVEGMGAGAQAKTAAKSGALAAGGGGSGPGGAGALHGGASRGPSTAAAPDSRSSASRGSTSANSSDAGVLRGVTSASMDGRPGLHPSSSSRGRKSPRGIGSHAPRPGSGSSGMPGAAAMDSEDLL